VCSLAPLLDSDSSLPELSKPHAKIQLEPCIPTRGTNGRAGPDWLHEVKHVTGNSVQHDCDMGGQSWN
jgi:hypothetical protein